METNTIITAQSPGKIILSGEYAVLYGSSAIAMAVNRFMTVTIEPFSSEQNEIYVITERKKEKIYLDKLIDTHEKINKRYESFLKGNLPIVSVLENPLDLTKSVLASFILLFEIKKFHSMTIRIQSEIPIGCGMGSSAALISALLLALSGYFRKHMDQRSFIELAIQSENLQHGKASQLDLRTCLLGGGLRYSAKRILKLDLSFLLFFLINTGKPQSTTGECVTQVAENFSQKSIWRSFRRVTSQMNIALKNLNCNLLHDLILENHYLLCKIQVVPEKVKHFISLLEEKNFAAKVCGAGSVSGETAGIVLVLGQLTADVQLLCKQYQYEILLCRNYQEGVKIRSL